MWGDHPSAQTESLRKNGGRDVSPLHGSLPTPDADILKSQRAQAGGVEQVLCVHDERLLQQMLDAVEIECAKFGPACADNQRVRAFGHGIR